jgi:cbb3-type cytochrome oxidase cytochrome c subunit
VLLDRAFRLDFERNGPSLFRLMQAMMTRWLRYGDDSDPRVRARVAVAARQLRTGYGAALWAMERYLRTSNATVSQRIRSLRLETEREFGTLSVAANRLLGPVLVWASKREGSRYPHGRAREPRTFIERRVGG